MRAPQRTAEEEREGTDELRDVLQPQVPAETRPPDIAESAADGRSAADQHLRVAAVASEGRSVEECDACQNRHATFFPTRLNSKNDENFLNCKCCFSCRIAAFRQGEPQLKPGGRLRSCTVKPSFGPFEREPRR